MRRKSLFIAGLITVLAVVTVFVVQAAGKDDIAQVREATAKFHQSEAAQTAGYDLVPGLDHCFESYGVGGMGYHYINTSLLDTIVELSHPEAMVYTPGPNGTLQLGAVEYVVPAAAWDAEYDELPQVLGHSFHLNETLGVYVLHAWIWKNNPSGLFEDWNPNVSCPVSVSPGGSRNKR